MTSWMVMISPSLVLITLTCVMLQRIHLLMALLALEAMILSLVFMLIVLTDTSWLMFVIVILTFGACEASLGLACMTAMSRSYGNDRLNSLSLNKC
uniref:NADH-ubiquinone oxidoreductase chain 4L n=1 Tax=Hediste diversicolor TaxID=126592 RepID=A0A7T8G456_HEDDI|nr:NADH dehydrogenase subunit 4L [Hediste diversicolor]QQP21534.1 NADH dehydrogenase subunit 4L [Hediste diversicolor]